MILDTSVVSIPLSSQSPVSDSASVALTVLSLVHCTHYPVWSLVVSCLVYCSQGLVDLWTLGLPLCQHCHQNQSRCLCPCRVPHSDTLCRSLVSYHVKLEDTLFLLL